MSISIDMPEAFLVINSIRRSTMKESYINLNTVIQSDTFQKSDHFKQLFSSISPLPWFEESLRLIVIDCLQLKNEVLKILLRQDDNRIKRILRCKWFFKNLSSEFCTSEIFPYVSLSLRCKIINRLFKYLENEEEAEKYFAFIKKNYDNQRAYYLLPRCSSAFISSHLKKYIIPFYYQSSDRILLNICKRYPEVGLQVLTYIVDRSQQHELTLYRYNKVVRYMAGNHSDLFVPWLLRFHSYLREEIFGRKLTKKLGRKLQCHLFGDLKSSLFKFKYLFSVLSYNDKKKLLVDIVNFQKAKEVSLNYWTAGKYSLCQCLKLVPPNARIGLIQATFFEVFEVHFNDYSKCWSYDLLELLPVETRRPYVEKLEMLFKEDKTIFIKNVDGNSFNINSPEHLFCLYDFDVAFQKLKKLLQNVPEPSRRQSILQSMVKNCSINSDVKGLHIVIHFVTTRHRNDELSVISNFIRTIIKEFPWSALEPEAFSQMHDLVLFSYLKEKPTCHYEEFHEKYIYHLMENQKDVTDSVTRHIEFFFDEFAYPVSFLNDFNSKHSRTLLLKFCKEALRWVQSNSYENEEIKVRTVLRSIIRSCADFNKCNPKNRIKLTDVPNLKHILQNLMEDDYKDLGGEKWPFDIFERYSFDVLNFFDKSKCLYYALKQKPELIESHLKEILMYTISFLSYRKDLISFFLKIVSFYQKMDEVKTIILSELENKHSTYEVREGVLTLYSYICTIEEFTAAVQNYIPKEEEKIKFDGQFAREQFLVPRLIKNVRPRCRNFHLILKFLRGDFLKSVKNSLHACCFYTRLDVVIPFLKNVLDAAPPRISMKKDVIRIIAELSSRDEKSSFCMKCWDEFKHPSIRRILYSFIIKLFLEEPTRESFRVLKKCISESDITIINKTYLERVPDDFLEDYVSALMWFSENQEPGFRNDFQQSILSYFRESKINLLSPDFWEKIFRNNLFNPASSLQVEILACTYLIADPNAVDKRVQQILDLVKTREPDSRFVSSFLHSLIQQSLTDPSAFPDVFAIILENWPKYPVGVLYAEHLLFTYHNLHQKVLRRFSDLNLVTVEFASELKKLYSSIDNFKDLFIIFAECLKKFFESFTSLKTILVVKNLVTGSKDRTLAILGVLALPEDVMRLMQIEEVFGSIAKAKELLIELVRILESYGDDVVTIFVRRNFIK